MLVLAALAALVQVQVPVDTLRPAGGPEVVWSPAAGPLVALRLSVPLPADLPPGAAELVQELARPAAEETAEAIGASIRFHIAADDAVLSLTGPATAFDAMAAILRGVVREPDLSIASIRAARARAEDRALGALEEPERRLRALVHARLHQLPPRGPALDSLDAETLRALGRRLHRPDHLRVVLVGHLPEEVIRSAFARWETTAAAGAPTGTSAEAQLPVGGLPPPQAHHAWAVLAFPMDAEPAALLVAAELVDRRLRTADVRGGAAEAWRHGPDGVLVVLGGAAPGDAAVAGAARITAFPGSARDGDVGPLPRFLRRMVAEAATLASAEGVAEAAAAVRTRMLLDAATASGRASLLGAWSGGADGATFPQLLDALGDVRLGAVRDILDRALGAAPLLVEVRP